MTLIYTYTPGERGSLLACMTPAGFPPCRGYTDDGIPVFSCVCNDTFKTPDTPAHLNAKAFGYEAVALVITNKDGTFPHILSESLPVAHTADAVIASATLARELAERRIEAAMVWSTWLEPGSEFVGKAGHHIKLQVKVFEGHGRRLLCHDEHGNGIVCWLRAGQEAPAGTVTLSGVVKSHDELNSYRSTTIIPDSITSI